jgi:pimeloyl-ACP methyl ester carboxylesterase
MGKIELCRTRFGDDIVAEFLPSERDSKKVAILTSGAPGYPGGKGELMQKLSRLGYWSIVPRYRGTWESNGTFLEYSPAEDVQLIMSAFGGPAAILNSGDERVRKAITLSAVTDWRDQQHTVEPLELMNQYVPEAFGMAYRPNEHAWEKLTEGNFYNPATAHDSIAGEKLLLIHAIDDKVVHAAPAEALAKEVGATYIKLPSGGHMGVGSMHEPKIWKYIEKFLKEKK